MSVTFKEPIRVGDVVKFINGCNRIQDHFIITEVKFSGKLYGRVVKSVNRDLDWTLSVDTDEIFLLERVKKRVANYRKDRVGFRYGRN